MRCFSFCLFFFCFFFFFFVRALGVRPRRHFALPRTALPVHVAAVPGIWSSVDFLASHAYPASGIGYGFNAPMPQALPGLLYYEMELAQINRSVQVWTVQEESVQSPHLSLGNRHVPPPLVCFLSIRLLFSL